MKVTRKVGRRSRKYTSSISRRRFRNNKNKKSSYKKRYTKTHKGGCWSPAKKGGARSRKYGHKRGKRFHRGGVRGVFTEGDIEPGSARPPTIQRDSNFQGNTEQGSELPPAIQRHSNFQGNTEQGSELPSTIQREELRPSLRSLPNQIDTFDNKHIMPKPLKFDYKRTDRFSLGTEPGDFDVVILYRDNVITGVYLLRHDKKNPTLFDKVLLINTIKVSDIILEKVSSNGITDIPGFLPYNDPMKSDGTYTLPVTNTNKNSFQAIRLELDKPFTA